MRRAGHRCCPAPRARAAIIDLRVRPGRGCEIDRSIFREMYRYEKHFRTGTDKVYLRIPSKKECADEVLGVRVRYA